MSAREPGYRKIEKERERERERKEKLEKHGGNQSYENGSVGDRERGESQRGRLGRTNERITQ